MFEFLNIWTVALAVLLATFFMKRKSRPKRKFENPLEFSKKFAEWNPRPLVEEAVIVEDSHVMGKIDEKCLNVGATSFLCLERNENIKESAVKCLKKYGVGSCGPRGFYGTIDVHLELEERLAQFLEVEESCVYSYGFSTIASAIPAYAKRGDIIFVDECVSFQIQKGLDASRSVVKYFKHNDMKHLEELLKEGRNKKTLNPKRRAFMVVEAIYYNTGDMCPLKRVVELCRQYKLRIILDESLTIGVLGKNGRGITEYLDIPRDEIDLIVGSLENSFGTIGGFCAGSHFIVEHQRLSGLGYCFSASLPPLLTQAAISALDVLEEKPEILEELHIASKKAQAALATLKHYRVSGIDISPIKHIYLAKDDLTDRLKHSYLRNIGTYCLDKGVAFAVASYLRDVEVKCPEPSIRFACSRKLNDDNLAMICKLLDEAYEEVGPRPDIIPVAKSF